MDCNGCKFQNSPKSKEPCFNCTDGTLWWPESANDEGALRNFINTLTDEQITLLKQIVIGDDM